MSDVSECVGPATCRLKGYPIGELVINEAKELSPQKPKLSNIMAMANHNITVLLSGISQVWTVAGKDGVHVKAELVSYEIQ